MANHSGPRPWEYPFTLGVGGVVVHDGHVLLVLMSYGPAKGFWTLPGGFVDRGETPEAAVVREVREETGVEAAVEALVGIRFRIMPGKPPAVPAPEKPAPVAAAAPAPGAPESRTDTYVVFRMRHVAGLPQPDQREVAEARWWPLTEALASEQVAGITQSILQGMSDGAGLHPRGVERLLIDIPYFQLYT